jgi:hypothetical protein
MKTASVIATLVAFAAAQRDNRIPRGSCLSAGRHAGLKASGRCQHEPRATSQRVRKRIEEGFGWIKTYGGMRKTRHVGNPRVAWTFTLTAAVCNLVLLPKLLAAA